MTLDEAVAVAGGPWAVSPDGGVVLIRTASGKQLRVSSESGAPLAEIEAVAAILSGAVTAPAKKRAAAKE